jgi:protein ImuB
MWIAIRFPLLPLEIFLRGSSTPEPFAVEEHHCVLICDRKAAARGVRAGMAASAALALAPNLRIMPRDPAGETEALLGIAAWAGQFTPGVALEFPSAVLLEAAGSTKLFHGLEALVENLRRGVADLGYGAVMAGAPTPRAASWLALAGEQKFIDSAAELEAGLATLPLQILSNSDGIREGLEAIGVRTLGELRALPRDGLARRFGQPLLDDLDRASGRLPDPRNFFVPPEKFRAGVELPAEVTQAEALAFAARRLIVQLAGFLAARSGGVQRFTLKLAHRDASPTEIVVGLVAPSRDAEHFTLLLRERLGSLALREPARSIALETGEVVPLPGSDHPLLLEEGKPPGRWEPLVERLRARLGVDAVHGLACRAEHRPERAVAVVDPGVSQGELDFGERPLWLLESPESLREIGGVPHHEGPLELVAGPERIESGWWDGGDVFRDYFIARTQDQSLVWIFCDRGGKGGWYLHGVFA